MRPSLPPSPLPDLYVLDAVADDSEEFGHILERLNDDHGLGWYRRWGKPFTRDDIMTALVRLVRANHVRAATLTLDGRALMELPERQLPDVGFDSAYFAITLTGRMVHAAWDPGDLTDLQP